MKDFCIKSFILNRFDPTLQIITKNVTRNKLKSVKDIKITAKRQRNLEKWHWHFINLIYHVWLKLNNFYSNFNLAWQVIDVNSIFIDFQSVGANSISENAKWFFFSFIFDLYNDLDVETLHIRKSFRIASV